MRGDTDGDAEEITELRIRVREADAVVRGVVEALEALRDDIGRRLEVASQRQPVVDEIELQLHAIVCELRQLEAGRELRPLTARVPQTRAGAPPPLDL